MSTIIQRRITRQTFIEECEGFNIYAAKKTHWCWILNCPEDKTTTETTTEYPIPEKILNQVKLDVERAFCFDSGLSKCDIINRRRRLLRIICRVLARNPTFKYYQGFHEICSLFTIVFENSEEQCILAIERFGKIYLKNFFTESFDDTLRQYSDATISIISEFTYSRELDEIRRSDPLERKKLKQVMSKIGELVEPHGLLASWFLTWFVHEFSKFEDSLKLFHFQLTGLKDSKPLAPIYISSALIMVHKQKILNWQEDPFELIMFLRQLPKQQDSSIAEVINCARLIHKIIPPEMIFNHRKGLPTIQLWMTILFLHFIYLLLAMTLFPDL